MARKSPSEKRPSGRPGSPRARLFVALDPPTAVREELGAWRDGVIAQRDDLRPVAAASLHVTLAFLGYRPEREIPKIARAVAEGAARHTAPRLAPRELVPLPPRRPRLFALDLEDADGQAVALQAALSDALERGRFYKPEKRPFWPHITLARVKRDRQAEPLPADPPPVEPFIAREVVLYRSLLRPQGALYEPLETVSLPE